MHLPLLLALQQVQYSLPLLCAQPSLALLMKCQIIFLFTPFLPHLQITTLTTPKLIIWALLRMPSVKVSHQ